MQTKFEACYELRIPVHNPTCFVENQLEQYRFLGFSLKALENTDILCGLIVTGAAVIDIMLGSFYKLPQQWILTNTMTLLFFLLFLGVSELIFQVRHKRKVLKLQLTNYFENTLRGKLENQYLYPEENAAYQQEYFEEDTIAQNKATEQTPSPSNPKATQTSETTNFEEDYGPVISADMQELIDSLLAESKINRELNQKKDKLMTAATSEKFRLVEEIMKEWL